jgi:hypothetical protein
LGFLIWEMAGMGEGGNANPARRKEAKRGLWPPQSLNFFMADMQAGPFLGVFLLAHHWESGLIGQS